MKVVVENLTGTLFHVQVGNDATVADLKREIETQQKLPYDRLILILDADHSCCTMNGDGDEVSLLDYGVQDGSHIYIFFYPLDDQGSSSSATHRFVLNWPDSLLGVLAYLISLLFLVYQMTNLEKEAISVKPEKFSGYYFRRWQKQLKYWLTVLGLMSAIEEPTGDKAFSSWLTPEDIEYHCYNRILSALSDHLYDVYHSTTSTAKELWDALEAEYGIIDAGVDRFTVSNFNSYRMVENKSVGVQIHEFQELLRGIEKKGTKFSEDFKVSCLIDKLPASWNEYAKTLRHKQGEFTLRQAINSLRVEEKQRVDQKERPEKSPVVNLVNGQNFSNHNKNKFNNRNQRNNFQPRGRNFKNNNTNPYKHFQKSKDQGREKISCFVCGRTNHVARNCFYKKIEEHKSKANQNGPKAHVNMLMEQESSQPLFKNQVEDV